MITTKPLYGSPNQPACTRVSIRFKESKLAQIVHRPSDSLGAHFILFAYSPQESVYVLSYINNLGMLLKQISYAREAVMEVDIDESLCRVIQEPNPPLKAV